MGSQVAVLETKICCKLITIYGSEKLSGNICCKVKMNLVDTQDRSLKSTQHGARASLFGGVFTQCLCQLAMDINHNPASGISYTLGKSSESLQRCGGLQKFVYRMQYSGRDAVSGFEFSVLFHGKTRVCCSLRHCFHF